MPECKVVCCVLVEDFDNPLKCNSSVYVLYFMDNDDTMRQLHNTVHSSSSLEVQNTRRDRLYYHSPILSKYIYHSPVDPIVVVKALVVG